MNDSIAELVLGAVASARIEEYYERTGTAAIRLCLGLPKKERRYPVGTVAGQCDIVLPDREASSWIECKFSWTYSDSDQRPYHANPVYWKHLFSESPGEHSAIYDLRTKLPSLLAHREAKSIGFLLICFDSKYQPQDPNDIRELESRGELNPSTGWHKHLIERWPNPRNSDCGIQVFLWLRDSTGI